MTAQRGSETRQPSTKELAPELEAAEGSEPAGSDLTAEIEGRAYEIYLSRNGAPGDPVADWLQAERELRGAKGEERA
jgi:hypothetical protein